MVTIITEKLKSQHLDDVPGESIPVPVPRSSGNTWTFTTSDQHAYKLTGRDTSWSPLHSDKINSLEKSFGEPRDPWKWTNQQRGAKEGVRWAKVAPDLFDMDSIPNTPPAPPKKRHCRSLSVPGEGMVFTAAVVSGRGWQPQPSSVWRPVQSDSEGVSPQFCTSPQAGTRCRTTDSSSLQPLSKSEDLSNLPMRSPTLPDCRPASAIPTYYNFQQAFMPIEGSYSRLDTLRVRSLSMEDPITGEGPQPVPMGPLSQPCSPSHQMTPRCRSQPSVLHERKSLKRRRGEDRPALDFLKMKETAYYKHCHKQGSNRYSEQYKTWSRSLTSLFSDPPGCPIKLNTIASSPLDSTPKDGADGWLLGSSTPSSTCATLCSSSSPDRRFIQTPDVDRDSKGGSPAGGGSPVTFIDRETSPGNMEHSTIFDLEMNDLDLELIEKH